VIARIHARNFALACSAALLAACSSLTTISSPNPGTKFELEDKVLVLPASTRMGRTTFGHFAFRATEPARPDATPFYGILPLALRKGQLVAGIVLTAPVMLLTKLRGGFRFYDIDVERRTIRYRNDADAAWIDYTVTPQEEASAREWFEEQAAEAKEEAAEQAAEAKEEAAERAAEAEEEAAEQAAEAKEEAAERAGDEEPGSP
jgi:flagellar biosynthesis GTPase FlhF